MDKDYFDFPDRRHIYLCTFQHTVLPHSEDHDGKDKSAFLKIQFIRSLRDAARRLGRWKI